MTKGNDTNSLFAGLHTEAAQSRAPLAERMRPETLEEYCGQGHAISPGSWLRKLIENDDLPSLILWGPPGCGKTTLGRVLAKATAAEFVMFSAILSGVKEIREIVREAEERLQLHGRRTILFIDEIHRFNKSQQDAFLPFVESGVLTIVGATTENPSFEINAPLLSRAKVVRLEPLGDGDLVKLCERALRDRKHGLGDYGTSISAEALALIAAQAEGDARKALGTLEIAAKLAGRGGTIDSTVAQDALQKRVLAYDKGGEEHYNVISAFIKSIRASDPDAAVYWLARMLEAGEEPRFILRRIIISASEDVGNADPRALQIAVSALQAFELVGMPEGRIILAQAVTYLACAPKSNASYNSINSALDEVRTSGALPVPVYLRNAPTKLMKEQGYGNGYRYPHDEANGYNGQRCLPVAISGASFYEPKEIGFEKHIREFRDHLKGKPRQ